MERYGDAVERGLEAQQPAVGMTAVEERPRVLVPERPGDAVNEFLIDIGPDDPLGADAERRGFVHPLVGAGRYDGLGEEPVGTPDPLGDPAGDRHQLDGYFFGQLGDGPHRIAGDEEEDVEPALAHHVYGRAELDVDRPEGLKPDAVAPKDEPGIDLGARPGGVERDPLSLQPLDAFYPGVLARDDMDAFGIEVGDRPEVGDPVLAAEHALAGIAPIGDVGLAQARFEIALGHGLDVVDRAMGSLGDGDQAGDAAATAPLAGARTGRVADGAGDQAADGEINARRGAGADAKEPRLFRRHPLARGGQDKDGKKGGRDARGNAPCPSAEAKRAQTAAAQAPRPPAFPRVSAVRHVSPQDTGHSALTHYPISLTHPAPPPGHP